MLGHSKRLKDANLLKGLRARKMLQGKMAGYMDILRREPELAVRVHACSLSHAAGHACAWLSESCRWPCYGGFLADRSACSRAAWK